MLHFFHGPVANLAFCCLLLGVLFPKAVDHKTQTTRCKTLKRTCVLGGLRLSSVATTSVCVC